ncbi:MAG TPA: prepilin peptidase [Solirubrobacterales bacterium]|nr:prepilin peptidase [Solirubrobacterales bacterium]
MDATAATILFFLAGLLVGSFLTVVAHRVPLGESIVGGRSRCPACGAQIAAYDNVPVLSWLVLRGRARCCGEAISSRYPLTELATGVLYAAIALAFHDDVAQLALGLVFVTTLVAVTLTDLERRIIPNKILAVAAVLAVAIAAVGDPSSLPERAIAAIAAGGLLLAAALAYPRGMGLGDVKLAATMGLFLGRDVGPAILVALLAGSVVGLAMIARHGAAARKRAIPFGPFLALGGIVGLFAGEELIDWYLSTF